MESSLTTRLALCGVVFAWFVVGVSPDLFWLDAGELSAATEELGVVHPPGTPGYTLLTRLLVLLPLGTIGFRCGIASALCMTVAIDAVLTMLARRGAPLWIRVAVACWIATGTTVLRNASVVEIYGLSCCLGLLFLSALDAAQRAAWDVRQVLWALFLGGWAGWCFGNLRVLLVLAMAWVFWRDRHGRWRWVWWAPVVVCAASLPIASLPLSSLRGPSRDWGNPETLTALIDHLQARSIVEAYAPQILPSDPYLWWRGVGMVGTQLAQDLGGIGFVLAAGGLLAWLLGGRDRWLLELCALFMMVEVVYGAVINPMGIRDRQTGMIVCMVFALIGGVVATDFWRRRRRVGVAVVPLLAAVSVVPLIAGSLHERAVTRSWMPHAWARDALAVTPPRGLMSAQSDDLISGVISAQVLDGARPDVLMVIPHHLHKGPSDTVLPAHAPLWRAVAAAPSGEANKVRAAWHSWRHGKSAESPGQGANQAISRPDRPGIPVSVEGVEAPPLAEQATRWLAHAESGADRQRIARALDGAAETLVYAGGTRPAVLAEAEMIYRLVLREVDGGHVASMVSLAVILDGLGRTESAIHLLQRVLALEPHRAAAHRNLALFLSKQLGVTPEVLAEVQLAARLQPWDVRNWKLMRTLCSSAGDEACVSRATGRMEALGAP